MAESTVHEAKEYVDRALSMQEHQGYSATVPEDVYQNAIQKADRAIRSLGKVRDQSVKMRSHVEP
jgi:hypothetical protein